MNRKFHEAGGCQPAVFVQDSQTSEIIGSSMTGRPLVVQHWAESPADFRIFILAGQHGDEPEASRAASDYLKRLRSGARHAPARVAVLADANPDGSAARTRRNSAGIDLNRDHLFLYTSETRAVHSFVDRWRPHLIIDVHTYRPRRPELLKYDLIFTDELMIDFATNPAAVAGFSLGAELALLEFMKSRMAKETIRCDRYTLVRPSGIVRHSTPDILDARNSLSLRYGIPTVLLEGRRSSPEDPPNSPSPYVALLHAVEAVVEWAGRRRERSKGQPAEYDSNDQVPIQYRFSLSKTPRYMQMQSATGGEVRLARIPGVYLPFMRVTRSVTMPKAYAVPRRLISLLEILARHHFPIARAEEFNKAELESYRIARPATPCLDEDLVRRVYIPERSRVNLDNLVVFPTRLPGGWALALFLEPESQFGLARFPELLELTSETTEYPVRRVL